MSNLEPQDPRKSNRTDRFFTPENEKSNKEVIADHALAQGLAVAETVVTGGKVNPVTVAIANEVGNRAIDTALDIKDGKGIKSAIKDNFLDEKKETEKDFNNQRAIDDRHINNAVLEAVEQVHAPLGDRYTENEVKLSVMRPSAKTYSNTAVVGKTDRAVDKITRPSEFAQETDPKEQVAKMEKHPENSLTATNIAYMEKFISSLPKGNLKQRLSDQLNVAIERGFEGVKLVGDDYSVTVNPNHDTARARGSQSIGGR